MKRVLVTGSGGFVGRAAVEALQRRGFDVRGVEAHDTDLLDPAAAAALLRETRPTHLLHLAWVTMHGEYWSSPENEQWVRASEHLFRAFRDAGGERIAGVGTCAEYDWSRGGIMIEDVTPLAPSTVYGAAKAALYRSLMAFDPRAAWARLFFLYGPHEAPQRFVPSMMRGETCRDPDAVRDFLYVDDAGEALALLVDSRGAGAFNVGSGTAVTLGEVAEKLSGRPVPRRETSGDVVVADITRLRNLGFEPKVSLDEGLRRTMAWWSDRE